MNGPGQMAKFIRDAAERMCGDIEVLSDEQMMASPGEGGRRAVDYCAESAMVLGRIAARLRGEEPPEAPKGWYVAPGDLQAKDALLAEIRQRTEECAKAMEAIVPEDFTKVIAVETSPLEFGYVAAMHTMYHDAQLNMLQAMGGDLDVHWKI